MSETVNINRCLACMNEMGEGDICPHCGMNQKQIDTLDFALRPGSILHGRYLMGKALGRGGFGITYIGFDMLLGVKVAIKEYFPTGMATREGSKSTALIWSSSQVGQTQKQSGCDAFLSEARKMAKVNDIYAIVRVRDTFTSNDTAYIIMDYVEGQTLKERLKEKGPMTYEACIELLMPIIEGLSEVHKQGIIHRDISPDNIMIGKDGKVRLLDLGAAKDMSSVHGDDLIVAKSGFSPVEQYNSKGKIGAWTDVYALCATIYYCITGKVLPAAADRVNADALEIPAQFQKKLPASVIQAMKDGLAVKAEDRIQSMDELKKRLKINKLRKYIPAFVATAGAALLIAIIIFIVDATKLRVDQLGYTNANGLNSSLYLPIGKDYIYYIGGDSTLYCTTYDEEDEVFYLGDASPVFDEAAFLCLTDDKIYFASDATGHDTVYQINHDGSGLEEAYTGIGDHSANTQYVKLSDGEEYFYFMLRDDSSEDDFELNYRLYRYNINSALDAEGIEVEENVIWYNLYDDGIYAITLEEKENEFGFVTELYKYSFDGEKKKLLDNEHSYSVGFIEDDTMFMYDFATQTIVSCDLKGRPNKAADEFAKLAIDDSYGMAYGDGWLYYVDRNDAGIHRVQKDGTRDELIIADHTFVSMTCNLDDIYFVEEVEDQYGTAYQSYVAYKDGTNLIEIGGLVSEVGASVLSPENFEKKLNASETGWIITEYVGTETEVKVPSEIEGYPVVEIGEEAFCKTAIEKIAIPNTVEKIGKNAFFNCQSLNEVSFSNSLKEIEYGAFGQCYSLEKIRLPESLENIGQLAFAESYISAVYIGENVVTIGNGAFASKNTEDFMTVIVAPNNKNFASKDGVLYDKEMTRLLCCPAGIGPSFEIPAGVKYIRNYAFAYCKNLTSVEIPQSMSIIWSKAFANCNGIASIRVKKSCSVAADLGADIKVIKY